MSDPVEEGVVRASKELAAARLLADNGLGAQAGSSGVMVAAAAVTPGSQRRRTGS